MDHMLAFLPVYNRAEQTFRFIKRLQAIVPQTTNLTVYVLDAGSTDNISKKIESLDGHIEYVPLDETYYWGKSLNKILEMVKQMPVADDTVVGIFNNDTLQFPQAFYRGIAALDEHDIINPLSLLIDYAHYPEYDYLAELEFEDLIRLPSVSTVYGRHFDATRGKLIVHNPFDNPNVGDTAGFLTRAGVLRFLPTDLIPDEIPHYLSDYYLTYSLSRRGFQLLVDPAYYVIRFTNAAQLENNNEMDVGSALRKKNKHDPRSQEYLPAILRFREEFSKESHKQTSLMLKRCRYHVDGLLRRAA